MEKFNNKYRIASGRLQNWDYGRCAIYFMTICTAHREHYFGTIENGNRTLSEIGLVAEQEWIKTNEIRPDMNLTFGDFVVMPNHFHALIGIGKNEYNTETEKTGNQFGPQSKNLASIVRGFKSAVTTYARKNHLPFEWQARYHDHVIRNDAEFDKIAKYIRNNISQWENDKFHKKP